MSKKEMPTNANVDVASQNLGGAVAAVLEANTSAANAEFEMIQRGVTQISEAHASRLKPYFDGQAMSALTVNALAQRLRGGVASFDESESPVLAAFIQQVDAEQAEVSAQNEDAMLLVTEWREEVSSRPSLKPAEYKQQAIAPSYDYEPEVLVDAEVTNGES